jgi:hypothetical protein
MAAIVSSSSATASPTVKVMTPATGCESAETAR